MPDIYEGFKVWLQHCRDAKDIRHTPKTEGGEATYDYSIFTGCVSCQARGCTWVWPEEKVKSKPARS